MTLSPSKCCCPPQVFGPCVSPQSNEAASPPFPLISSRTFARLTYSSAPPPLIEPDYDERRQVLLTAITNHLNAFFQHTLPLVHTMLYQRAIHWVDVLAATVGRTKSSRAPNRRSRRTCPEYRIFSVAAMSDSRVDNRFAMQAEHCRHTGREYRGVVRDTSTAMRQANKKLDLWIVHKVDPLTSAFSRC